MRNKYVEEWGNNLRWEATGRNEQMGPGIYLAFNFDDFADDWMCAVTADKTAWAQTEKAYLIPKVEAKCWLTVGDLSLESDVRDKNLWYNKGGEYDLIQSPAQLCSGFLRLS